MADSSTTTDWGNLLGSGASALANYWGNSNATNALTGGEQNAINTQTGVQGQLSGIYGPQRGLGNGADVSLANQLGIGGGPPNYSAFNHSPGYQFALDQGNQAIDRTAAANGSLYTPNTLAMLSQYNTGYASQNYNTYISQLMGAAGLGAQGNSGLSQGIYNSGANVSQLQQNQGNARAGGQANNSGITSSLLSKVPWGQVASGIGSMWNGSNGSTGSYGAGSSDMTGGLYNGGSFGGGAPLYDPSTGGYPGGSGSTSLPTDASGNVDWLSNASNPS